MDRVFLSRHSKRGIRNEEVPRKEEEEEDKEEDKEEEEEEEEDVVKSYENATRATRATTRFFYIFLSAFLRIKTALYSKKFQYRLFILLLLLLLLCSWPLLRTSPLPR